jgi:hypothetical protein
MVSGVIDVSYHLLCLTASIGTMIAVPLQLKQANFMSDKEQPKRSRRSSGAITLRDVAMLAGVAPITASRAINTPNQVSPDVLRKVQEAVQRTGYVPNRMAGGLASSRSRLIAAVVPSTVVSVFMETIESLNSTLFDAVSYTHLRAHETN